MELLNLGNRINTHRPMGFLRTRVDLGSAATCRASRHKRLLIEITKYLGQFALLVSNNQGDSKIIFVCCNLHKSLGNSSILHGFVHSGNIVNFNKSFF